MNSDAPETPSKEPISEDPETVRHLAETILEPALRKAMATAREEASPQETLSALANCYAGLLVDVLGRRAAVEFMKGHADHIASRED